MNKSLAKKLGVYSAIGLAGGMTFGTTAADADIVFTEFAGGPATLDGLPVEIDIDDNGVVDFMFDIAVVPNTYGSFSNQAFIDGGNNRFVSVDPSPFNAGPSAGPNNLAYGEVVSSGQPLESGMGPLQFAYTAYNIESVFGAFGGRNFPTGNSGYIGVEFEGEGNSTLFGWISVSVNGDLRNDGDDDLQSAALVINGFAYQTDGNSIQAGSVPEPTSLGLLALGAVGVLARRRR